MLILVLYIIDYLLRSCSFSSFFFFFNDTATTEIYTFPYTTLFRSMSTTPRSSCRGSGTRSTTTTTAALRRSEEHTSELQSPDHLVCRLPLEKKKRAACGASHFRIRIAFSTLFHPAGIKARRASISFAGKRPGFQAITFFFF